MIIHAKYKNNPSRTVDATERTQFSKSRPNDLEDIGQGQGSSHATHPLMLLIICTKYGKNPSWTVDAAERTMDAGRTDGRTNRRTDGRSETNIPPTTSLCGGYDKINRSWQKFYPFQSWSRHINMPNFRPFPSCVRRKIPGNCKFYLFH